VEVEPSPKCQRTVTGSASGSVAVPVNVTDCPAVMLTLPAGAVIVPDGDWSPAAGAWTTMVRLGGLGSAVPSGSVVVMVTV